MYYRGWDVLLKRRIRLALPVLSRYNAASATTDTTAAATADSSNDSTTDINNNSSSGWRVVTVTLLRHPRSGAVRIEAVAAPDITTVTTANSSSTVVAATPLQGITAAAAELPAVLHEAGASHLLLAPTLTGSYSARCTAAEARSHAVALALVGALRLSPFVQDAIALGALAYHRARSLAERALLQCTSWALRLGACIRGRGRGGAEVLREVRRLGSRLLLVRVSDDWGGLCIEAIDTNRREVSSATVLLLCVTLLLLHTALALTSICSDALALSTTCKLIGAV
jgi:hypothetical protein